MDPIALRRLRLIAIPPGPGLSPAHKAVFLSELAGLGVRVGAPELLDAADPAFLQAHGSIIAGIRELRGGDVDYVPLFSGFPDAVPDDEEHLARRILAYLGPTLGLFDEVPGWLFDLSRFGADPVTQHQTRELFEQGRAEQKARAGDRHTEWMEVQLVTPDALRARLGDWLCDTLYAKSSIKAALHHDVRALLGVFGADRIDPDRLLFKENRTFVLQHLWQAGDAAGVVALAQSPTDLLRLFAALTDTDPSLSSKVRFPRLTRAQRRLVLSCLESAPALAEDLRRYTGLWKELGRYLHPGEHRARFPRTAEAFDALRNGRIQSFEGTTERLIAAGDVDALLSHLSPRPGVLGRRVHELLRRFPQRAGDVLEALRRAAPGLALKNLLVLEAYFSAINELERRTIVTKLGRVKVLPNNARHALSDAVLSELQQLLSDALADQLRQRSSWQGQAVWIDPVLDGLTVPLQQRAASDGLLTLGRGSRLPIEADKVLRLFVWWQQAEHRTDLDLSVVSFDEDFRYLGHVSYTQLSGQGMAHSGDLVDATHGAAEFIDIDLQSLPEGVAYLASNIYRYSGESFCQATCHAGWMVREDVNADYASFDASTVQHRFDVNGIGAYCLPVLIDLRRHEVVIADLYVGSRALGNNVEGSCDDVGAIAREIARMTTFRPTLGALVRAHVAARGAQRIEDRQAADQTFGMDPACTFDVGDVSRILSELI